jgi:hypothetical protein
MAMTRHLASPGGGRWSVVGGREHPWCSGVRLVAQRLGQVAAPRDPQLLIGVLEVGFDRSNRQMHVDGELLVSATGCRQCSGRHPLVDNVGSRPPGDAPGPGACNSAPPWNGPIWIPSSGPRPLPHSGTSGL